MKYSVVIPTYNHLEDCLKPCLESIVKYTDFSKNDTEIIVVANGCTDGTKDYVQSLGKHFKLIWIDEPSGYTKSTNIGIKASQGEYVILLNNDTVLLQQNKNTWISMLVDPFSDPEVGATGPLALYDNYAQEDVLIFFCVMIKRKVFDEIGLLDEIFSPGGGEDIDFTVKLKKAGYRWVQVPDNNLSFTFTNTGGFPIFHVGEGTFNDIAEYGLNIIKKNGLVNCKRYSKNILLKINSIDGKDAGYLHVHPDKSSHLNMPFDQLDFDDKTVYHIIACDLTKDIKENNNLVKEWYRVLREDGKLTLEENGKRTDYLKNEVLKIVENDNYKKVKIYDCFPFFNELDVLEIRLNTLNDYVDYFVLCEMPLTHSGKSKELFFEKNKDRFNNFLHKIIYLCPKTEEIPNYPEDIEGCWSRERFQRQYLINGLKECNDQDWIMISDLDEIPNPKKIKEFDINYINAFQQKRYNYYLNLFQEVEKQESGIGSKILTFSKLKEINDPLSLCLIRYTDCKNHLISDGGWHFSYIGGAEKVISKIESWAHQEWNESKNKDKNKISQSIKSAIDPIFGKNLIFENIDNSFPDYIVENQYDLFKRNLLNTSFEPNVTAYISTKNRYFTTLPLAIMSIVNQTYPVKKIVIFDDADPKDRKDLRELAPYKEIFALMNAKKINWYVFFGEGKGQVLNHQKIIDWPESTEWLWRVDDDDFAEPDCLEKLMKHVVNRPEIGAVGGAVHMPSTEPMSLSLCSGKIEHILSYGNVQWASFNHVVEVDHLHNTFVYKKEAAKQHGYNMNLSPVGHREETLFTYGLKRNNWRLIVDGSAKTWHLRDPNGGIRSYQSQQLWEHDELIFRKQMDEYGVKFSNINMIMLDCGLGDHLAFKQIINEVKHKYGDSLKLAVCYREVFEDDGVEMISIAEGKQLDPNYEKYNVYKWCIDNNWNKSLVDAFRQMYGIEGAIGQSGYSGN